MKVKSLKKAVSLSMAAVMALSLTSVINTKDVKAAKSVTLSFGSHQSGLPTSGIVQNLAKEFEKETGIKLISRFLRMLSGVI